MCSPTGSSRSPPTATCASSSTTPPPEQIALLDQHHEAGTLDMDVLLTLGGPTWCASLTFAEADLRTVYVGSELQRARRDSNSRSSVT